MSAPPATGAGSAAGAGLRGSVRRILPLAWPLFIGQLAVLGFGTIDTVLVARHSPTDLAALAVGGASYITVFIGLMGVVLAISPTVGQLFGAKRLHEAGRQVWQALWLALGCAVLGCALLAFPAPFLALSKAGPEVADKVRGYLLALAVPGIGTVLSAMESQTQRGLQVDGLIGGADLFANEVVLAMGGDPAVGLKLSDRLARDKVAADILPMSAFRRSNVEQQLQQLQAIETARRQAELAAEAGGDAQAGTRP